MFINLVSIEKELFTFSFRRFQIFIFIGISVNIIAHQYMYSVVLKLAPKNLCFKVIFRDELRISQ